MDNIQLVPGDDWLGTLINLVAEGAPVNLTGHIVVKAEIQTPYGFLSPTIEIITPATGVLRLSADRANTADLPYGRVSKLTITTQLAGDNTTWLWGDVEGVHSIADIDEITVTVQGPQGPQGPSGAALAIGVVTTGAAGSSVSVTNTGTPLNAVLNFTIPRGDKGNIGYISTSNVAGTANAITATTDSPVSDGSIVGLKPIATATGTTTISFNGGAALTIKKTSGGNIANGDITAAMSLLGVIRGSNFELYSDIASQAIVAQCQAIKDSIDLGALNAAVAATGADRVQTGLDAATSLTNANTAVTAAATAQAASSSAQQVSFVHETYALLDAQVAPPANTGAQVLDSDTNFHLDPVVGGMVANAGTYKYSTSPAGWKWIGATGLAGKASSLDVFELRRNAGHAVITNKLRPATGNLTPTCFAAFTAVSGKAYELFARVHAAEMGWINLFNGSNNSGGMNISFNLSRQEVSAVLGTGSILALGGGWFEIRGQSAVATVTAGTNFQLRPSSGGVFPTIGNNSDGVFVDIFELREVGSNLNLFASNNINNAAFTKTNCAVVLTAVSSSLIGTDLNTLQRSVAIDTLRFNGAQIATRLTEGSGSIAATMFKTSPAFVSGQTYEFSAKVAKRSRKRLNLFSSINAAFNAIFDLEKGIATGAGASMTYDIAGYWLCKVTGTAGASGGSNMQIRTMDDIGSTFPRTGDGVSTVAILEAALIQNGIIAFSDTNFGSWSTNGLTATANAETYGGISPDLVPYEALPSPIKNKKVSVIGTSVTSQAQYTAVFAAITGCVLQNLGVSGASLASGGSAGSLGITNAIASINTDADYVLIEAGTNDFGTSNSALGAIGDTTTATFYGALYNAYVAIKARATTAKIAFLTPYSAASSYASHKHFWTNANGNTLRQFQNAVIEVAALLGVPVIDVGREANIGYLTSTLFSDGLHINAAGGAIFGKYLAARSQRLVELGAW
jgi:lysophospholipase L1-like esterase